MNLKYSIQEINTITKGIDSVFSEKEYTIQQIIIDSRNYFGGANTLFIAIKGPINDGHKYISDLYAKGCRSFIIEKEIDATQFPLATFVKVTNAVAALQLIATHHRLKFNIPIIGITGSNGKTIVKEWLYYFLKNSNNVIRSPKSYNSQVGVAISLLQITENHTLGIIEAGISQPGEMEKLQKMIQPTYGILTAIGRAHSENFSSTEQIELEKTKLFEETEWFYNYSSNSEVCSQTEIVENSTKLQIIWEGDTFEVLIPFTDEASVQNSITCIGFLLKLGKSKDLIQTGCSSLPSLALRLESKQGRDNNVIIDDSYSSDIISLKIGLNHLNKLNARVDKIVILSDIAQEKTEPKILYQQVADLLKERNLSVFYAVGPKLCTYKKLFDNGIFFETTQELIEHLKSVEISKSIIYIKGARYYGFEKVGKLFEHKNHDTQLTIDLGTLRNNIRIYLQQLSSETKILGMIKAFGYGSGGAEVGKVLVQSGIEYLGVAYADEGEALRNEGIDAPIIVMNSEEGAFDKIIDHQLEPSIFSFRQLDKFIRALINRGLKSYPIHLKLDTGMNRLGFIASEIEELISAIASQPEVRVRSVFSHLAASESVREDLFTTKQIQKFQYATHKLETGLGYDVIKHILNSSGVERFNHAQFDMVRLGLGMYGSKSSFPDVEPIAELKTVISQVKTVRKGESVGYGRSQYALRDSIIGIIPIGYADGFSRALSRGKGSVWINGQYAPVFGAVCMDMTMIDLTDIPAKEGDKVEIFGKNKTIVDFAKDMDTITYEVMTSISQRVVRVYVD
ncbi:MAG: alanine racemase [Parvicella sp.]|jgi:alanine racemase